jgi:hypothetical protein
MMIVNQRVCLEQVYAMSEWFIMLIVLKEHWTFLIYRVVVAFGS